MFPAVTLTKEVQGPEELVETCFNKLMAGLGVLTVIVSEAVLPVPPFVEETLPLVLEYEPVVGAVISTFTVQVPPAATVPALNVMEVAFAAGTKVGTPQLVVEAFGVVATRICPGVVGNVSVNATPVRASF